MTKRTPHEFSSKISRSRGLAQIGVTFGSPAGGGFAARARLAIRALTTARRNLMNARRSGAAVGGRPHRSP